MLQGLRKSTDQRCRVLEFYSGIGGMRYSLMKSGVGAEIVEAFDINNIANDVYEHNFGHRPHQGNIQTLSAADLDMYQADAWLLSPPCQPYTRQGLQKGSEDVRAFSFLQILELIPLMMQAPHFLFVENVVGFETSDTHWKMIDTLERSHFAVQEFILSPIQFGVPYSRPRYFCLAKRKPLSFLNPEWNNQIVFNSAPLLGGSETAFTNEGDSSNRNNELLHSCKPIESFLEPHNMRKEVESSSKVFSSNISNMLEVIEEENGSAVSYLNQYFVPLSLIEKWGSAMGILFIWLVVHKDLNPLVASTTRLSPI